MYVYMYIYIYIIYIYIYMYIYIYIYVLVSDKWLPLMAEGVDGVAELLRRERGLGYAII